MKTKTTLSKGIGFDRMIEARGVAPLSVPVAPLDHKLPTVSGTVGPRAETDTLYSLLTPQHITDISSEEWPSRIMYRATRQSSQPMPHRGVSA